MSEEDAEIVSRSLDATTAFMKGELSSEALAQLFDSQIEFHWRDQRTLPDLPQHLRGASEMIEFALQMRSAWSDFILEPLEFIETADDRILVVLRQSGRGRASGAPAVVHSFCLYTIRDGKISKVELFRHRADALEAAGLRE
jgi:ketosteroid isomerase-like protein